MSYSSKLSAHYLGLVKTSVSKGNFAGENVRFSSEYEALESKLGKAQSMHESGQIDCTRDALTLIREQPRLPWSAANSYWTARISANGALT